MKKKLLVGALLVAALPGPAQGAAKPWGGFTGYEDRNSWWWCEATAPGNLLRFLKLPCGIGSIPR